MNSSRESGPTLSKKATTKDGGVKSSAKLAGLVAAFNKKKNQMSPVQRKKVAARIKALKQGQGKKGTLAGE